MKIYGKGEAAVRALDNVDMAFARGRFTAVMGPSGSGKSTLMHCVAGLDELTSGTVRIGDTDVGALTERERAHLRRDRIGFIFQAFNLVPTLTAAENIVLPLSLAGRGADADWLAELVDLVGLGHRLEHRPHELSGGQAQRVAVARALITRPELVIADEPTGNLDSTSAEAILRFLRDASDTYQRTVVMVTHDPVAASYAHRVEFLADGKHALTLDDPTPERILGAMRTLTRRPIDPAER